MPFPRPDDDSIAFFRSIVPDDDRVQVRPMFGHLGAFVNGNMFIGIFGSDVFVRLMEEDRTELLAEDGASTPEPMPGRRMREYVTIPEGLEGRRREGPGVGRPVAWLGRRAAGEDTQDKKEEAVVGLRSNVMPGLTAAVIALADCGEDGVTAVAPGGYAYFSRRRRAASASFLSFE